MPTCFVIQPFDEGGKFDKRFQDNLKPALEDAGLEAYRVDLDPSVDVPIDSIESNIRDAVICLADITTDNPNVWYELGYAFALGREVILICSSEREGKYPFDIQHRNVTSYQTDSGSDYQKLRKGVTDRAKALMKKGIAARQVMESEQLAPSDGLTHLEILVLTLLAGETAVPDTHLAIEMLKRSAEKTGLTDVAFGLACRKLIRKGLVVARREDDGYEEYLSATVSSDGWGWLESNESLLSMRRAEADLGDQDLEDDIPF